MAINYAVKYATKVAERFHLSSLTDDDCGTEYSFLSPGSQTIRVSSVDTVPETQYKRTGDARFGETYDVGDTLQELTCTQAPAFSFTIDRLDGSDQAIQKSAGSALRRQLDEVTIPGIDMYRIKKWALGGNIVRKETTEPTKGTIGGLIIDLNAAMTDALVPLDKRTLYIGTKYYKLLKQNADWLGVDTLGREALQLGVVGEFDGCRVKPIPTSYMPAGIFFFIKRKGSTVDPVKLAQYDVIPKVKGFSGPLVQGVTYHDAFVLGAKADGIAVCGNASTVLDAPAISISGHQATLTTTVSDAKIRYTTDGTNPRYSATAAIYTGVVPTEAGQTVKAVAEKEGCIGLLAEEKDA